MKNSYFQDFFGILINRKIQQLHFWLLDRKQKIFGLRKIFVDNLILLW